MTGPGCPKIGSQRRPRASMLHGYRPPSGNTARAIYILQPWLCPALDRAQFADGAAVNIVRRCSEHRRVWQIQNASLMRHAGQRTARSVAGLITQHALGAL